MITAWKREGLSKPEIVVKIAEACMGWPYVFGARGQLCTSPNRSARRRDDHPTIVTKCQVLSGSKQTCIGCKWYPGGSTRMYDCRGFTYWVLLQVGVTIMGAGATSQWNDNNNWEAKGEIKDIPLDRVSCVFKQVGSKMEHTGLHVGGGKIIHCSSGVQTGKISDKGWTHFAIPRGLDGDVPIPEPEKPTLKRGSRGVYVLECQEDLIKLGYDVGKTGADSIFGANTEKAVKAFQKASGLKNDGIVGHDTWKALDEAMEALDGGVKPTRLYVIHIPHLTELQADALMVNYPDAWKTVEEE